jgi:hypothetical protein
MLKKMTIETEEASLGISIDSAYDTFTALYNPSGQDPDEVDISASKASVASSKVLTVPRNEVTLIIRSISNTEKGTFNDKPRISPYRSGSHCIC